MGVGIGILLIVLGLILVTGVVNVHTSLIDMYTLGWIFLIVGILAVVLALVINAQRSRTKVVEETRVDDRRRI